MAGGEAKAYTRGEELANSITHGIGTALGVAALSILVTLAGRLGDAWRVVSFSVYGTTLILLYLASTFYHAFPPSRAKQVLRKLDHAAIFLLIAGTYTPFTLVSLRGPWGWSLFGVVWGLALAGIALQVAGRGRLRALALGVYIAMGWLVMVAIEPLTASVSPAGLRWLVIGGCCYTFGVAFYVWRRLRFNHAIWHLCVLAGSICHFFAILFHVLPMRER